MTNRPAIVYYGAPAVGSDEHKRNILSCSSTSGAVQIGVTERRSDSRPILLRSSGYGVDRLRIKAAVRKMTKVHNNRKLQLTATRYGKSAVLHNPVGVVS